MKFELTPYNLQELGQRQNQEDSLFPGIGQQTTQDRLFILCDGMGGHEKGEVASSTVCETMSKTILSRWNPSEPLSDELLQQAIEDAYDALDAKDNGSEKKMGTTMTFLCFHANGVTVAHIGDSRVYQLRPAKDELPAYIVFQTRDHSLVNDLIKIGDITEEEAKHHPQKNVITRAMQPCQERRAKADIKHLTDVQDGDYFYMCSDGMLEETSDENLIYIICKKDVPDEQKVEMLRSVTKDNKDNHTAHLIHIGKPASKGTSKSKSRIITAVIAFVVVLCAVIGAYMKFSKSSAAEETAIEEQLVTDSLKADSLRKASASSSPKNNADKKGKKAGAKTADRESKSSSSDGKQDKPATEEKASQNNPAKTDATKKFLPKQTKKTKSSDTPEDQKED